MPDAQIVVRELSKTYRVPRRESGLKAALRSLTRREYTDVPAVQEVTFSIERGEMVGFIGPNGAGKTTTLKMLSGLLQPTSGEARIAGFIPWERSPDYLRQISMVMGNRNQMLWDIPPQDSFRVLAEIYSVPQAQAQRTVDELAALLEMEALLTKPIRNLSLGERMKCELVGALLHRPIVLFLDEPTLGLDISMQLRLRTFIAEYNRLTGATVILTSHYMADVVELCERVILIQEGKLLFDGKLSTLSAQLAPFKMIRFTLDPATKVPNLAERLPTGADLISQEEEQITVRVERNEAAAMTAHILNALPIVDLSIENPPVEAVIDQIYQQRSVA